MRRGLSLLSALVLASVGLVTFSGQAQAADHFTNVHCITSNGSDASINIYWSDASPHLISVNQVEMLTLRRINNVLANFRYPTEATVSQLSTYQDSTVPSGYSATFVNFVWPYQYHSTSYTNKLEVTVFIYSDYGGSCYHRYYFWN